MDKHYFKIVYIKNLKELEPIPHMWEEGGTCWFPKLKRDIKVHQCNAASLPDKKNWPKYSCAVKVTGIVTWTHANNTADTLCKDVPSSTSESTSDEEEPQLKRSRKSNTKEEFIYNLDDEHTQININEGKGSEVKTITNINDTSAMAPNDVTDDVTEDVTITNNDITNAIDLATLSDMKALTETVTSYHAEVNSLKSYFDDKFVSLSLGIDNILKTIQQREDAAISNPSEDNLEETHFFPLSSKSAMQSFEESLQNDDYQKKVILHLRKIIGSGFPWIQACYKLTSVMFTKELLVQYSWTGVSRTEKPKEPFNKLSNMLGVFFHVIRFSDPSFTYSSREIFFRDKVLKHSQSRLHPKKRNKENQSPQISAAIPVESVEAVIEPSVDEDDSFNLDAECSETSSFLGFDSGSNV